MKNNVCTLAFLSLGLVSILGACRTDRDERTPPDWPALRQQYPEIFELVEGFECGQSSSDILARVQRMEEVEVFTLNTVGSQMELRQGPVRFGFEAQDFVLQGPYTFDRERFLLDRDAKVRRHSLCPLLVLGPEYYGAEVFVDGEPIATVTAPRTQLTGPARNSVLRVVREGLPEVARTLSWEAGDFIQIGVLDRVFLRLLVTREYRSGDLYLDGARLGELSTLAYPIAVEPGAHHLRLVNPSHPDLEGDIVLSGEKVLEVAHLNPPS